MMQAVLPVMRGQGGGRIVNISSGTTRMAAPTVGGYGASKAALNMLSAVARTELAADGRIILRALRTGEEAIDIPHGAEQPELAEIPAG
jgi:NAD(P)-dependent dehydrogenase (short-subunit alcohol dehydrogenase family)